MPVATTRTAPEVWIGRLRATYHADRHTDAYAAAIGSVTMAIGSQASPMRPASSSARSTATITHKPK